MAPARALCLGTVALLLLALSHTYAQVISPSAASAHTPSPAPASPASPQRRNRPVILVPGFASTRLMAWKKKNCYSSEVFDVHVGDRVWLDVRQVAFQVRRAALAVCSGVRWNNREAKMPPHLDGGHRSSQYLLLICLCCGVTLCTTPCTACS